MVSCTLRLLCAISFITSAASTGLYTLSLHDALPISDPDAAAAIDPVAVLADLGGGGGRQDHHHRVSAATGPARTIAAQSPGQRSEEHTSELQSHVNLVCRLLLEKKNQQKEPKQDEDY